MSHSNGFHYSPYYQSNAEQDGRNQQSYQNPSRGNTSSYQRQPYSSMTTTPTTQYPSTTTTPTTQYPSGQTSLGATSSGGYTPRAGTQTHGPAMNPYPAHSRSSIDTTALGNLAYASSLGQDSRPHPAPPRINSLQQIVDYNRSQPASNFSSAPMYEMNAPSANKYDHHRSENHETASTRSTEMQNAYGSPYTMYPQDAICQPKAYASTHGNGNTSSSQAIQRPDSAARMTEQASKQANFYPHRPASGQNVRASHSHARLNSKGNQSSSLPQSSDNSTLMIKATSNGPNVPERSHSRPQPQQMTNAPPKPVPASSQTFQNSHSHTTHGQPGENQSRHQTQSPSNQRANVDNREQSSQHLQIPTTIDPNKIFNQVEHLKRQAAIAAEAEAARKATEDAARKKAETEAQAPINGNASSSSTKDQMELEMLQMIEKMRDYKAKDPNLFSQIWEQVKKGKPSARISSVQEPLNSEPNEKTSSTVNVNDQLPSPSTQNQLPLESELSVPPLQQNKSDQGKPPVQRRKRRSAKDPATKLAPRRQTGRIETIPQAIPIVRPSFAGPTNPINGESAGLVPGTQSMQAAMESFNKNRDHGRTGDHPEVVYVSGAGPFVPPSTEAVSPTRIHAPGPGPAVPPSTETVPPTGNHAPGSGPAVSESTVEAGPPTAKISGGTIWPQDKKWALANAARDALTSNSMNAGKSIAAEDIVRLSDQDPSYETLCEMLERRGFIIDRSHFARLLLTAVPALNSDDPSSNPSTVNVPKSQPHPPSGSPTVINSDNDLGLLIKNHNDVGLNGVSHAQKGVTNHQSQVTNGNGNGNSGTPQLNHEVSRKKRGKNHKSSTGIGAHSFVHFGMLVPPEHNQPAFGSVDRPESSHVQWIPPNVPMTESNGGHSNHDSVPIPLTKKQLAMKKSFAELVDLTQDVSDEEDKLRQMKAQLDMIHDLNDAPLDSSPYMQAPGASFDGPASNFVDLTLQKEKRKYKKRVGGSAGAGADRPGLNSSGVTEDEGLDLSQFKYKESQHDLLQSSVIVYPTNKKNDALRRSTYNPKTIARDILVSSGKHPTMAPLNHHLEILRRKFTHVDNNSDLDTFRWDLVDPGGLETPDAEFQNVDMNDADDEDVDMGNGIHMERRRMQLTSTVDGGVLVSEMNSVQPAKNMPSIRKWKKRSENGRGAHERHENGTVSVGQGQQQHHGQRAEIDLEAGSMNFVQNPDEETPINFNVITSPPRKLPRGRPPGSGKKFRQNGFKPSPHSQKPTQSSPHFQATPQFSPRSQEPTQSSPHFQTTPQSNSRPQEGDLGGSGGSEPRKRGRPPGSKSRSKAESSGTQPTIPTRPVPLDTVPLRPSGLRNNSTLSDGFAVVIEPHSTTFGVSEKKRKGESKEPKKKTRLSSMQPSTPNFKVYKCLWKNCPHELHNLETLQKHVRKHREEFDASPIPCLWEHCSGRNNNEPDELEQHNNIEKKKREFESDVAWDRHMKKHIDAYAWEFGDGPSTHPSDAEISDYLSDSQGRRVTPLVTANSSAPPDPLPLSAGKRAARAYHKAHGNITDAQKAQAEADSAKAQKDELL